MTELEPGQEFAYRGPAKRLSNLVALELEGRFRLDRTYEDAGRTMAVFQDARHGEMYGADEPVESHSFIVPLAELGEQVAALETVRAGELAEAELEAE